MQRPKAGSRKERAKLILSYSLISQHGRLPYDFTPEEYGVRFFMVACPRLSLLPFLYEVLLRAPPGF